VPNHPAELSQPTPLDLSKPAEWRDEDLMRIAQVKPEAFEVLYRRYVNQIYSYLYSYTYDRAEAEDLTSQTFLSAWKSIRRYRERGTFTAWLFRIARNKARDHHRQKRLFLSLDSVINLHTELDPATKLENRETLERVARLIRQLDYEQIEMLRLRFSAELSYAEIGAILGHTAEAMKMAFHRLYQKLRLEWKVSNE
jgi:RNA polymerase sigma factor (sigma-70 family)